MRCDDVQGLILTDYSDGCLKGTRLTLLNAHLNVCPACRQLAETVRANSNTLAQSERVSAHDFVWQRIKNEISSPKEVASPQSVWGILGDILYPMRHVVVTACVFIFLSAGVIGAFYPRIFKKQNSNGGYLAYVLTSDAQNSDDVSRSIEQYFL